MAVFIIVAASVATLASAMPVSPVTPAIQPDEVSIAGFRTYSSAAACQAAAARLPSRPNSRFVCLPVEVPDGLPDAY